MQHSSITGRRRKELEDIRSEQKTSDQNNVSRILLGFLETYINSRNRVLMSTFTYGGFWLEGYSIHGFCLSHGSHLLMCRTPSSLLCIYDNIYINSIARYLKTQYNRRVPIGLSFAFNYRGAGKHFLSGNVIIPAPRLFTIKRNLTVWVPYIVLFS
jgi:hypothetical protein